MNDLSNALRERRHCCSCRPIPTPVVCLLIPLFFIGIAVSIFILVVVHNAFFFVSLLLLSAAVLAFLVWNTLNWRRNGAILLFLDSFPDSDLRTATHGQLVKITGVINLNPHPIPHL
uniref:Uncharacterized protein n=1 Tax=Nelumbo nucifera TaxID=4432 RepID=A0A822YX60_NELNU|nr:TPA_asm: hypothetical protein HUJ06_006761 [Nelumbo nucifera]